MKARLWILMLVGATLCLNVSCTKEELKQEVSKYIPIFEANVQGKNWLGSGSWTEAQEQIVISATSTNASVISLSIRAKGTGEYQLGEVLTGNYASYTHKDTVLFAKNGKIIISKYDNVNGRISGTFSFEASNSSNTISKVVSDGKFNDIPKL